MQLISKMLNNNKKPRLMLWLFVIVLSLSLNIVVFAQDEKNEIDMNISDYTQKIATLEDEIRNYREFIQEATKTKRTLKEELVLLDVKIAKVELEIERLNLVIEDSEREILETQQEITSLKEKIKNERGYLAELIRTLYEKEETGMLEIVLSSESVSDFFNDVSRITNVHGAIQNSLEEVKLLKDGLEKKEEELTQKRNELLEFKALAIVQKGSLEESKIEKRELLEETHGKEILYQRKLSEATNDLTKIRKELFQLTGFGISITFEEALQRVTVVSKKTGVREALLLAIFKKESDWGLNVGRGVWYEDMHPRDWDAFFEITEKLGLNPDMTPVSAKPSYGWGGAMGPAQFLPTTWLGYEKQVAEITGHNPPSPWNLDDALAAAGLKLAAAGAASHIYEDEWRAAMIYFAGSSWEKPSFGFYGDGVMDLATFYQEQIGLLE